MASTRCTEKVTKRRKTLAQRARYAPLASQSRQVVMKAKNKQALKQVRLSPSAKQASLRQLPVSVTKKKSPPEGHLLKRSSVAATSHGYLLRSRSVQETPQVPVPSEGLQEAAERMKSLSTSHDSGIESESINTSDSEDSTASASESSSNVSFPSPKVLVVERPPIVLSAASNPIHQVTIDLSVMTSSAGVVSRTHVHMEANCSSAGSTPAESTFTVLADNLVHYGNECIPDFLQDIDEVISADTPSESCSSTDSGTASPSSSAPDSPSITEISLCHERLDDSVSIMDTGDQQLTTRYTYAASAGELEFVMEIFRGAHHSPSPLIRTPAVLPPKTRSCPTFTLILDLDETLVHCFTNEAPAKFDYSFAVEVPDANGGEPTELAVYARLRPFVREFLERVARKFEVVVFTASMKNYSSKMLDLLDPEGVFFKHRFYRDHCVPVGCSFVKDLSIFTRDLSKLIIVDNQIASFAFQIDNGIPIKSWIGDDDDQELMLLAPYLESIAEQHDLDVRHFIRNSLKVPVQLHSHVQTYYPQHLESPRS
ncbi:putative CTD small phosphatase-like protein 2 [Hypsibius exemplaris]|uniref:CTD small phosphatase-like protein 2 n=1 Tax=Hypsibius exemplaris TaxID=2072580 RepID=A0A1W0WA56_HYPEX|nr:putative CTD small phosphatase-like protein 2 [Hypsibius exemplaris]